MKIPPDRLVIPEEKLVRYLLVWHHQDDKSQFLAQAGFTQDNPEALDAAIRALAAAGDAEVDRIDRFGVFYRIRGELVGLNGRILAVITIWIQEDEVASFRFVTLKPWRRDEQA